MDSKILQIAYVAGITVIILYFVAKSNTKHKIFAFLLSFFIMGASIINEDTFVIKLGNVGADLQVRRIIFLLFLIYIFVDSIIKIHHAKTKEKIPYEKYLYIFSVWFIIVVLYHFIFGIVKFKEMGPLIQGTLAILVLNAVLKREADEEMILVLVKSMIAVATLSSIVAIIQFLVEPYFLRVGSDLAAFGGKLRSNGVYGSEYQHSYNTLFALLLVLLFVKSKTQRFILIGLFLIGIFFTFHRMSWIASFLCVSLYLTLENKRDIWKFVLIAGILLFTIFVLTTEVFTVGEEIEQSEMYQSRLKSDTMTGRLKFYNMVIDNYDQLFVTGVGSKSSPLYYYGMLNTGIVDERWALGERGGIHNGYLHVLFFYGMPALIFFCMMLYTMMKEYIRSYFRNQKIFLFSFLYILIYCIMNLTNAFPITEDFGFLLGIVIGCSAAISTRKLFMVPVVLE